MKALAFLGTLFLVSSTARALDITSCGQTIPVGRVGVLQADLACNDGDNSTVADGVTIERNGTLDLNGHSLTVLDDGGAVNSAVYCISICRVRDSSGGPNGRIIGHANSIAVLGHAVRLYDTDLDSVGDGIRATRVRLSNVTINGCAEAGVKAEKVTLEDTTISGCKYGILVNRKVVAKNSTISDNTSGGIDSGRMLNGTNVTITNNGSFGIDAIAGDNNHLGRIKLRDSQVLGHATDLKSTLPPQLSNTMCGTSEAFDKETYASLGTWGVCAND
jgi:hypothetical protein